MKKKIFKKILCLMIVGAIFLSLSPTSFAEDTTRIDAARSFADTVLKYGRYIEGSVYPELFVDGINTNTMESVEWKWEGETLYPSNFFNQQDFLRTLVGLSNLTGDTKYKEIAKKQMQLWFDNFTDKNGLIYTGAHTFIDAKSGAVITTGDHEMKNDTPFYELMYEVDPEATVKYMEAFWNAHILDWSNLSMNRHGAYDKEMSNLWDSEYTDTSIDFDNSNASAFQSTGNDLIAFAFFISEKTGNKEPEEWALKLLQKYIDTVDETTGLSGAQYGERRDNEGNNIDHAFVQFGAEFGDKAREYKYVNSTKIEQIAGYAPKVLLPYYEGLSDEEKEEKKYILDYVVKTIEGVATYAYDAENHRMKTPMWSDGTSLCGYELQRSGYYGTKGDTFPLYQTVPGGLLTSAIYAHRLSDSSVIWEFARSLARDYYNIGDIGTAPGENVSLNTNTTQRAKECINAMLDLYEETKNEAYLSLAERMGKNIINGAKKANMFLSNEEYLNAKISNVMALLLLRIEAAKQGNFDTVPEGNTDFGIEMYYDGMGRVGEAEVIYHQVEEKAQTLTIENDNIIIPIQNKAEFIDISGHSAQNEIRAIATLGAIKDCADGEFKPGDYITRSTFITYCAQLCGIETARLIDTNLEENNENITKEEAASVLVKALSLKNSETAYSAYGALSQFSDSDDIAQWAQEYCDIAASYYMVNNRGDEYFSPKANITRGDAAVMLKKLSDLTDTDRTCITYAVEPLDASKNIVTYTSSNSEVAAVDEYGNIFPLKAGTAEITAVCGDAADTCSICVIPSEDWMIKSIKVNGENIESFSAMTQSYTKELFIGETQIPQISAQSYSGESVTVILPKILPGAAKLYVEGYADNAYFLSLIPEKTNYVLYEDFESYAEGTVPHSITKDKAVWQVHSNCWVNGSAPIKITQHPITQSNAANIPYIGNTMNMSARFYDNPYIVGEKADEGYIVLEYDFMCEAAVPGLDILLGCKDNDSGNNIWAIRQDYVTENIAYNGKTGQKIFYNPGEVYSVKIIIDKKSLISDVYFNGTKVQEKIEPAMKVSSIDSFLIKADANCEFNTTLHLDNVKIYELPYETDVKSDFYNAQGDSLTRITEEATLSFEKELTPTYTGDVKLIGAVYSPEGILRKTVCKDAEITAGKTQTLDSVMDVSDMQKGDYLCVYIWTKELCPIIVQKLIYKC